MIERVVIKNYKCIKNANIAFNKFKNIIVGNNGVGKSTLMEAVSLALGYGLNKFEVTPHIFNIESIQEYKVNHILPEILIEVISQMIILGNCLVRTTLYMSIRVVCT